VFSFCDPLGRVALRPPATMQSRSDQEERRK
jgi:hypothetical protein